MKLWHFYHAYAQENREDIWLPIVNEHVDALHLSGLATKLSKTYIGVVGTKINSEKISKMFTERNIEHEICALDDFGWEQLTLNKLHEFSQSNSGYVLYTHTKGAAYPEKTRDLHRKVMSEHLINRWAENVDLLSNGFCATGVFFLRGSPEEPFIYSEEQIEYQETNPSIKRYCGFFAGNFWWCNLDLIKKMGKPSTDNRIKAEAWMNNLYDSIDKQKYVVYDMLPGGYHINIL